MPDPLLNIPLSDIDADALPRDRATTDPEAMAELRTSILRAGLRQPIELYRTAEGAPRPYGLISGHRRLAAFRALQRETIPAFLRAPASLPDALAAMVAENEVRAQITPWEKARLIQTCLAAGLFETPDAAIDALFPAQSRQKRSRLRGHLMVAEAFDGCLSTPERLSTARLDRLAAALRSGWEDLLRNALPDPATHSLESQWTALAPVLAEALSPRDGEPAPNTPRAPRRMARIRTGLTVRRELTRTGWILRFSGPEAKSPGLIDDVLDRVERWFGEA
ncbi:ParB/RepB/Spo0J family partition protein [Tropicimonas isoalkanivorans]|uniref:Chromosome partitioning protein, ParB family n=1 Tax=Tropicimonas isoalkanivorans TaxID=441112 RepID=A0A1I1RDX4_9RHOB|nr:ParB/RepB/Spo0J family partition protein [Tropicimonas isoalkanivorans]SFD32561.1 chromosome partitioning protein, ParB family [Tropicimonas isoalkanivorans]